MQTNGPWSNRDGILDNTSAGAERLARAQSLRIARQAILAISLLGLVTSPAAALQETAGAEVEARTPGVTVNDMYADLGRRVRVFGGIFVDEGSDTLYAYLVPGESGDLAQLDEAITAVLGLSRPDVHRLEVLEGRYTFLRLKKWLEQMTAPLLGMDGVVLTSIDHGKNRLRVGVEAPLVVSGVEEQLAALGIPREAVNIEQAGGAKFPGASLLPATATTLQDIADAMTLRDKFRPVVGGLQVKISTRGVDNTAETCTLGFLANMGTTPGLVINSHCVFGASPVSKNKVYQPSVNNDNKIGMVTLDPRGFRKANDPKCPEGKLCRYSDSAFVTLDNAELGMLGFIARPEPKSDAWDGTSKFRIVEKVVPMKGMKVTRVSSQTGRFEGTVDDPCEMKKNTGNNFTYLCQALVTSDTDVASGDSGSPVFVVKTPPKADQNPVDVMLMGILWGAVQGDDKTWIVSPIRNVEMPNTELGPLKVCDPQVGC